MIDLEEVTDTDSELRETALLFWCGAATLTIRGSHKAKIGKSLEKAIARAVLTIIGLDELNGDFRLSIGADQEIARETDAEVRTTRGYVRMEVGLIGVGNSEVVGDKVGRMNRHSIILVDKLPQNSTAYRTAEHQGVRLIELRNNHASEEVRQHLAALNVSVQEDSITVREVEERVLKMPLSAFE